MNDTPITTVKDVEATKPGAIWVSVWGYDAAIANFYTVARCNGKSIWLKEIHVSHKNGNNWMGDEATPTTPVIEIGEEKRYVLKDTQYGLKVKQNEYASITPWGGSPIHVYNHH